MTTGPAEDSNRIGRRRAGVTVLVAFALVVAALGLGYAFLARSEIPLPRWAVDRVAERFSESFPEGEVTVDAVRLRLSTERGPTVVIAGIVLLGPDGRMRARLPELSTRLDSAALRGGQLRPSTLEVPGAELMLVRETPLVFGVSVGPVGREERISARGPIPELFALLEDFLEASPLGSLERIDISGLRISLDDRITERRWEFDAGSLTLVNGPDAISGMLGARLLMPEGPPARARLSFDSPRDQPEVRLRMSLSGVAAVDLGDEVPALGWLRLLDARISAAFSAEIGADGKVSELDGALDIGRGRLQLADPQSALRFDGARLRMGYDARAGKLTLRDILLDTEALRLRGQGHAYLSEVVDGTPGAVIAQLRFSDIEIDRPDLFSGPLRFGEGAADFRLNAETERLDIGQLVLVEGARRAEISGRVAIRPEGVDAALDGRLSGLDHEGLLALWPLPVQAKTRLWMERNLQAAAIPSVDAALRLVAGETPRFHMRFGFEGLGLRYMQTLPPIAEGGGYGVITHERIDIVLEEGWVAPPLGGRIDLAGSALSLDDLKTRGAPARIALRTESELVAALSMLDQEPFGFLGRNGLDPHLGSGRAVMALDLDMPLTEDVGPDQVRLSGEGTIHQLSSERVVPGRALRAASARVRLEGQTLEVSGRGTLDGLPFDATWSQPLARDAGGRSRVEGQVELSARALDLFGVGLPPGSVSGDGVASFQVELARDAPASFTLRSDLARLDISLAALGWRKGPETTGSFRLAGTLGPSPEIALFALSAPGLEAEGRADLLEGGGLDVLRLTRVRAGAWLDGPVDIRGRGGDAPEIVLRGGTLDLRRLPAGGMGEGGGGPLVLGLDRVVVADGIALTGVEGTLSTASGLNGRFRARVNGTAPVEGTVAPRDGRVGVRLQSRDGGGVLRAAGIFNGFDGGALDMAILPESRPAHYVGALMLTETRLRNAPAMAELLSLISVVGLLEQLGGEGIALQEVEARFRIAPSAVELVQGSAIGASLGITMEGVYRLDDQSIDMQGVVTPFYLINGFFEQTRLFGGLFGARRGEGVFGMSYGFRGPVGAPRVTVNPLSILTPGMFRELFRRPPPGLER